MSIDLKPCPFCGKVAVNVAMQYATCGDLYCVGHQVKADFDDWNRRATETEQPVGQSFNEAWEALLARPDRDCSTIEAFTAGWDARANVRELIGAENQIIRIRRILETEDTYDECVRKIEDVLAYHPPVPISAKIEDEKP